MSILTIHPIPALKDNYIWAITDSDHQQTVIVDPGEAKAVEDFLREQHLTLKAILITHHHWDHMNGVMELKNHYHVPVIAPNENIPGATRRVSENDVVTIPNFPLHLKVFEIPGHTLGHVAYYTPSMLFCGDTLFSSGCGRIFEGTPVQMYASLLKITALPNATQIYCAHEYTLNNLRFAETVEPGNKKIAERIKTVSAMRDNHQPSLPSTLSDEKETNPFLRCDSPEIIANVERYANQSLSNPIAVFTWLRKWKDTF